MTVRVTIGSNLITIEGQGSLIAAVREWVAKKLGKQHCAGVPSTLSESIIWLIELRGISDENAALLLLRWDGATR